MNPDERQRLIDFLRRKMCGPCRRGEVNPEHDGCVEASDLIELVDAAQ